MTIEDKPIEDLSKDEITEALLEEEQPPVHTLKESAKDLKAMGIRDISELDENEAMNQAMQNIQIQRTLNDMKRKSTDNRSPRDYLEQHLEFLVKVSKKKRKKDIAKNMTLEHARAVLKLTAKMDLPEKLLKKHLKNLKKKYS